MKKIYLGIAVLATVSLASVFAQDASTTTPVRPVKERMQVMKGEMKDMKEKMGAKVTTGDTTKDEQIKALNNEMEEKIKAIRDEYQAKIKAIVGDTKPMIIKKDGSTTTVIEIRKEVRGEMKDNMENASGTVPGNFQNGQGEGKIRGFFRGIFGR